MTPLPTPDDALERLLREDARREVPDDGFTRRVMEAMPAAPARAWLRPALLLGSAALGGLLAWLLEPAGASILRGFLDLARLDSRTPSALAALGAVVAIAVTAGVLAAEED